MKQRLASVEEALYGREPMPPEGASDETLSTYLREAMHYYASAIPTGQKKKWFLEYLDEINYTSDFIRNVDDSFFAVAGTLARIHSMGTIVPDHEEKLKEYVAQFEQQGSEAAAAIEEKKQQSEKKKAASRAAAIDSAIELVFLHIDRFIMKKENRFSVSDFFTKHQIAPDAQEAVRKYFVPLRDEVASADEDHVEAYSFLGNRKPEFLEMLNSIVNSEEVAVVVRRRQTKQRKPRAVNPKKAVARLKFCPETTIEGVKYSSIEPTKVVGSLVVWVYNHKYRLLGKYVAKDSKGIQVKGTSLKNCSVDETITKKLRRPEETLPKVVDGGKVVLRNLMDSLTTKPSKSTGRLNEDVLILKVQ